jgi:ABC-type sugar transport system permease subunit
MMTFLRSVPTADDVTSDDVVDDTEELTGATHTTRTRRKGLGDAPLATLFVLPVLVLLGIFEFYPFVAGVADSFYHIDPYTFAKAPAGIRNYVAALSDPVTRHAFIVSAEYVFGAVILQAVLGMAAALVLNQGLKGQGLWRGLMLMPFVVPAIVTAMMFQFLFNGSNGAVNYFLMKFGLIHSPIAFVSHTTTALLVIILVTTWHHTPFMVIILLARLQTVPQDALEAAAVDGANAWQRFRKITLPWLLPVLLIGMLLRTIWTATEFDFPFLTTSGGPLYATTVVPIRVYSLYSAQQDAGQAAAVAVCLGVILLLLALTYLAFYRKSEKALA